MATQGTTTVDFGAFPGKSDTSAAVTGQASITTANLVEAWLVPTATADHSADEHLVETISIKAGTIVNATGFTIYAVNTNYLTEAPLGQLTGGGKMPRVYGLWTVAWVWN
jgi:hypothetical protein